MRIRYAVRRNLSRGRFREETRGGWAQTEQSGLAKRSIIIKLGLVWHYQATYASIITKGKEYSSLAISISAAQVPHSQLK